MPIAPPINPPTAEVTSNAITSVAAPHESKPCSTPSDFLTAPDRYEAMQAPTYVEMSPVTNKYIPAPIAMPFPGVSPPRGSIVVAPMAIPSNVNVTWIANPITSPAKTAGHDIRRPGVVVAYLAPPVVSFIFLPSLFSPSIGFLPPPTAVDAPF
jgi:hypothetical protein